MGKKSHNKKKNTPAPEKIPPQKGVFRAYHASLKEFAKDQYAQFQKGLDPHKIDFWKNEAKNLAKTAAYSGIGILSVTAIMMVLELHSHGRVFPGTKVAAIDIGYKKQADAQEKLLAEVAAQFQKPLAFRYEDFIIEVTPKELGIVPDMERIGRKVPVFDFRSNSVLTLLAASLQQKSSEIQYSMNGDTVINELEKRFHLAEKKVKNARMELSGKNLVILPEMEGVGIQRKELLSKLDLAMKNMNGAMIEVEIEKQKPDVTAADLEKEKARMETLLKNRLDLQYQDNSLSMRLMDHLQAVSFGRSGDTIQIRVNESALEEHLAENLFSDIETPTSPASIKQDENGKIVIEGSGENGKTVPRHKLKEAMELAANEGISQIQIPVHVDKAPLTIAENLKDMGITELVATGHSAYYGSPPNRMFNIEHGMAKYNGLIIAPGEEFSFNTILGEVDGASGFKPEKVIKGNKIEVEYGGGICQVSTTLYRAVLQAGLPITERKPHSWKVSYYGQSMGDGLDATIYPGVTDLKFVNDTPSHMVIQTFTDGPELYFKLYGTNDGRTTTLDGPYGGGLTYRWTRTVVKNGEETVEEIWSQYKPIPPPDPLPVQQ